MTLGNFDLCEKCMHAGNIPPTFVTNLPAGFAPGGGAGGAGGGRNAPATGSGGASELIKNIEKEAHSSDKLKVIEAFFTQGHWSLSHDDFAGVFKALTHASDIERAAEIVGSNIARNYCEALAGAMEASPHGSTKIALVERMAPYIRDLNNVSLIFAGLTHSSDKCKAAEIIGGNTSEFLSCAAVAEAMEECTHSSDKMAVLEAFAPHIGVSRRGDRDVILDALTHASDKEKAAELLA